MYRMHDAPDAPKAAIVVDTVAEALAWNTPEKGFGIFQTVNTFAGARRKENLVRIDAWCVDMDAGTKHEMAAKIHKSPLVPTMIVETKRGYQVYWAAQDGAKPQHWNALVLERLVPFFGADKNARDLCRILRVPGFLHLKDPADPFKCIAVHRYPVMYTEKQIWTRFPYVPNEQDRRDKHEEARKEHVRSTGQSDSGSFWEAVYNLDCEEGLGRLSGHGAVGGERYTFRRCSSGNVNILVDGKGTSCFIDSSRRIGSLDGGGPTLYAWLRWFKNPPRECVRVLKELFPELEQHDARRRAA
jgi:hypothetical protein